MNNLVHFVRWEVIPQETWDKVFEELPSWGAESIGELEKMILEA